MPPIAPIPPIIPIPFTFTFHVLRNTHHVPRRNPQGCQIVAGRSERSGDLRYSPPKKPFTPTGSPKG
jgi:hypothetical protein